MSVRSMKETDRMEMMQVILTELGHSWDERLEKTGREWMVLLLLGLCRETNERRIERSCEGVSGENVACQM